MFGGENGVFHTGGLGFFCPFARVKQIRIEVVEILLVLFLRDELVGFYPFVPRRKRIQTEMDEHTEPVVNKPACVAGGFVFGK